MFNIKNPELFLADIRRQFGWAVEEQAQAIINGEEVEDQNPNALKLIFDVADRRKEYELAEVIADHLGIEYMPDAELGEPDMSDLVSDSDFLNMVDKKFGWAIHQQAKSIMDDPTTIDEQNPNALGYILDLAETMGREDIAILISDYLDGM